MRAELRQLILKFETAWCHIPGLGRVEASPSGGPPDSDAAPAISTGKVISANEGDRELAERAADYGEFETPFLGEGGKPSQTAEEVCIQL